MDSGADITLMNGALFKEVAAAARLKKKDFQPADKVPKTYDQQAFSLDGKKMNLDKGVHVGMLCVDLRGFQVFVEASLVPRPSANYIIYDSGRPGKTYHATDVTGRKEVERT